MARLRYEELRKYRRYVGEKYRSLVNVLDDFVSECYGMVKVINDLTSSLIKPDDFKRLCEDVKRLVQVGAIKGVATSKVPLITLAERGVTVGIIDKGSGLDVGYDVYLGGEHYNLYVRSRSKLALWYSTFSSMWYKNRWEYVHGPLPYVLLLIYKFTNAGSNKEFISKLKGYNLYDIVHELSKIDFVIRYPILKSCKSIIAERLDVPIGKRVGYIFLSLDRALDDVAKFIKNRIEMGCVENGFEIRVIVVDYGYIDATGRDLIKYSDLVKFADEVIFAVSYYAALLNKMYEYLSKKYY